MNKPLLALAIVAMSIGTVWAQDLSLTDLRGAGSWKTDREAKRAAQRWSLDLKRGEDGTVSGHINVGDSPLFRSGEVHGKLNGDTIYGTITKERGEQVARFNGILSGTRFHGKYTDRTGETGEWEWEGPLPE